MSTRLREIAEIDGYIYKGQELEAFIRQNAARYRIPFVTHQERAQVIAAYPAHVHKFWVFRDPRRAKIGRSVYKRILHEKGIGGKKSRGNTAGRAIDWEPPTRLRIPAVTPENRMTAVGLGQILQREQAQPQTTAPIDIGGNLRAFYVTQPAPPWPWRVQTRTANQVPEPMPDFGGPEEEENEDND